MFSVVGKTSSPFVSGLISFALDEELDINNNIKPVSKKKKVSYKNLVHYTNWQIL